MRRIRSPASAQNYSLPGIFQLQSDPDPKHSEPGLISGVDGMVDPKAMEAAGQGKRKPQYPSANYVEPVPIFFLGKSYFLAVFAPPSPSVTCQVSSAPPPPENLHKKMVPNMVGRQSLVPQ